MDDYDAAKDAHDSYFAAIEAKRERGDTQDWEGRPQTFLDGRVTLYPGDCLDVLASLPENSVDSVVCDPPYHLTSIVKRFATGAPAKPMKSGGKEFQRLSAGFMGKVWDGGDIAFQPSTWAAVWRVLKPGGHLLAFSATRSYHRLAVAIEDGGFEIRDQIGYAFGSGFPKSHNITKAAAQSICRCGAAPLRECDMRSMRNAGLQAPEYIEEECGEVLLDGVPQQGAPADERKQLSAAEVRGSQSGMEGRRDLSQSARELRLGEVRPLPGSSALNGAGGRLCDGTPEGDGGLDRSAAASGGVCASHRSQAAEQQPIELGTVAVQPEPQDGGAWPHCGRCGKPIVPDGLGTALKPAWEPICVARKPLSESSIAANVLKHGTGAINIDGCRVGWRSEADAAAAAVGFAESRAKGTASQSHSIGKESRDGSNTYHPDKLTGRWPANLIHDGSEEVLAGFPETTSGEPGIKRGGNNGAAYGAESRAPGTQMGGFGDSGSAARFFYTAKADAEDRVGSKHPTVKPLDLMQYLCRLITPPGGTVLDPFAGTGTTGEAAWREGFNAILAEREPEYQADIARRMDLATKPTKRAAVAKTKNNLQGAEGTPLFGGVA